MIIHENHLDTPPNNLSAQVISRVDETKAGGNRARGLIAALGVVVLSACTTGETTPSAQNVTTQEAVEAFKNTCLASLPSFANFSTSAKNAGLQSVRNIGPLNNAHQLPGKRLFAGLATTPSGTACSLVVDSNDSPQAVGQALLSAARAATRGGSEKAYPSSFYNFAVHLPNGSLVTQDIREKKNGDRSIVFVTAPVTEEQIPALIFN
ncbi:MAG: hypothetical protein ABJH45_13980 [Paracoccaceae bacterium]